MSEEASDDSPDSGTLRPSAFRAVLVSILLIAVGQRAAMMLIPLAVVASGGSEASASAVAGLRSVGSFAVNLPAGMLMAGYGSYSVMLGGAAVLAGGISLLSFFGIPVVFGGGAVAAGLGFGAWFLARTSYVGRAVEVARRGRVLATMSGFGRTGNLIAPVVAGAMVDVVGFGGTFQALALVVLCAFVALAVFARSVRREEAVSRKAQAPSLTVFVGLARSHARTLATGALTISVIKILRTFQVVLMPLWGAAIGLSATWIGVLMSVSAVIDVAMAYPAGQLLDRVGRKAVVGMGLVVLIGGFACLAVSNSVVAFVVSSLMLGVGERANGRAVDDPCGRFCACGLRGRVLGVVEARDGPWGCRRAVCACRGYAAFARACADCRGWCRSGGDSDAVFAPGQWRRVVGGARSLRDPRRFASLPNATPAVAY